MEPLAVDLNLLKAVLATDLTSDLKLDIGRLLMVRVADVGANGRGTLSLAGMLLEAELPEGVSAGQELKLAVREVTPERVVLGIQNDGSQQTPVPLLAAVPIPMPGGGALQVGERGGSRTVQLPDGSHSVTIHYDAPSFGAVDMNFVLDSQGNLRVALVVPRGQSFDSAHAASTQLLDTLTEATASPVALSVAPRYEPLEVFA